MSELSPDLKSDFVERIIDLRSDHLATPKKKRAKTTPDKILGRIAGAMREPQRQCNSKRPEISPTVLGVCKSDVTVNEGEITDVQQQERSCSVEEMG
jgi:hypothetical protein